MLKDKAKVFIVCTGVGHINRGYESFTKECFLALKDNDFFEIYLLKGGGYSTGSEIKIKCIKRDSNTASLISSVIRKEPYWIEQATFLFGMLTVIIRYKPSVIYYSDFILGTFLWHLRRFFKFKYKLLFSNGAPNGPPFKTEDHVQQLLPVHFNEAIKEGEPVLKQTLLRYGFDIDVKERLNNINIEMRKEVRDKLGVSFEQKIILSIGAINKHHKRMDYVIDEVSKLPDNYFLVILGQFETETPELLQMAAIRLPGRHHIANVPFEKVKDYYIASNYFVLASLVEGFGRVLIEALSYGLPCIVNDYINAKEVLGEYGNYIDMEKEGALSSLILKNKSFKKKKILIEAAYNTYSWDRLKSEYSNMVSKLLN